MQPTGITPNLPVADLAEARDFYVDYLGLSEEGFNLGWVLRLSSPAAAPSSSWSAGMRPRPWTR